MTFKLLKRPVTLLASLSVFSVIALAAALASEAFLGLEPCKLCIYQRWPFLIVAILGAIGVALKKIKGLPEAMIGISGVAMLTNAIIATYHTGVEQKWWVSQVDGCVVPSFSNEKQSILENIMSAPTGRCDEIPWQDPLIGLSMANYNVIICFGLFCVCAASLYAIKTCPKGSSPP